MDHDLFIRNATLIDSARLHENATLRLAGGKIDAVDATDARAGDRVIDAQGLLVLPGFIEVHVQGAGGFDLSDPDPAAIPTVLTTCAKFGVTSLLATTIYRANGDNAHLARLAACVDAPPADGARILGLHIEGPFLSLEKKGMIFPEYIVDVSTDVLDEVLGLCAGQLRMMTLAPELPGALDIVERLVGAGVIASFGHSSASYEETRAGFNAGINHVTHLFNAMLGIHHREPGPLPAIFENPNVTAQLITDGVHLHPPIVDMSWRLLGPERCCLITDGIAGMGFPDGEYECNQYAFSVRGGTCFYENGKLIGTALGLSQLAARFRQFTGAGLHEIAAATSATPARMLGLEGTKGRLLEGYDGDLVLLDPDLNVRMTLVDGRIVYDSRDTTP